MLILKYIFIMHTEKKKELKFYHTIADVCNFNILPKKTIIVKFIVCNNSIINSIVLYHTALSITAIISKSDVLFITITETIKANLVKYSFLGREIYNHI